MVQQNFFSSTESFVLTDVQIEIVDENENPEIENSATIANSDSAHLTSPKTSSNSTENCGNEHSNVTENQVSVSASSENRQNENSNWFETCQTSALSQNLIAAQAENETSQVPHENRFSILNILSPNHTATSSYAAENAAFSHPMPHVKQIFIKRDVDEDDFMYCTTDADGCPL